MHNNPPITNQKIFIIYQKIFGMIMIKLAKYFRQKSFITKGLKTFIMQMQNPTQKNSQLLQLECEKQIFEIKYLGEKVKNRDNIIYYLKNKVRDLESNVQEVVTVPGRETTAQPKKTFAKVSSKKNLAKVDKVPSTTRKRKRQDSANTKKAEPKKTRLSSKAGWYTFSSIRRKELKKQGDSNTLETASKEWKSMSAKEKAKYTKIAEKQNKYQRKV